MTADDDEKAAAPEKIRIPVDDEELLAQCRIETFRAGGPGGQHQNKTESAVRLTHEPSGLRVTVRKERSQYRNRQVALERLRERLEERNRQEKPRLATRVPKREKRKRLQQKKRRGEKKQLRKPPKTEE